ncbi:MAG: glycosyltransferase family 2 protein [Bacteroidota bacterium]
MSPPAIDVVIPVYNGERFLGEAIASVLGQTYAGEVRLTVVDDGSTDGSASVAEGHAGVRVVRQANAGQPDALNHGVRLGGAPLVALLDADDVWVPEKLAWQVAALADDVDMVFGHAEQVAQPGLPEAAARLAAIPPAQRVMPAHLPSALLIRRPAIEAVSFRTEGAVGNVIDWYARAREAGLRVVMLDRVVYRRRIHDANPGLRERERAQADYLAVVKAALDRRRAADTGG